MDNESPPGRGRRPSREIFGENWPKSARPARPRPTSHDRERKLRMAPIRGAAMIDVLGAIWFIALVSVTYGIATGQFCLWRRD